MSIFGDRLIGIAKGLGAAIGAHLRRLAFPPQPVWIGDRVFVPRTEPERLPRLPEALWALFVARLNRAVRRLDALHAAWTQGTLAASRPRATTPSAPLLDSTPSESLPESPPATPRPRLPRAHGWLNRRVEHAHQYAGLLHLLLQDAGTRDFVQAVPRAARHLRPLCVALGIDQPAWLRLPPRPRKPRPKRPRKPRPPSLSDPSLNLRPWVAAASRAWQRQDRKKRRG